MDTQKSDPSKGTFVPSSTKQPSSDVSAVQSTTARPLLMGADSSVWTRVNLTDLSLYEIRSLSCCQSSLSAEKIHWKEKWPCDLKTFSYLQRSQGLLTTRCLLTTRICTIQHSLRFTFGFFFLLVDSAQMNLFMKTFLMTCLRVWFGFSGANIKQDLLVCIPHFTPS